MISNSAVLLALRNRALSLVVATTGGVSLSATATGYARAAGSFVTDGFKVGQEILSSGFTTTANNGNGVITSVTALAMTVNAYTVAITSSGYVVTPRTLVVEATAAARTIAVGFPAMLANTNADFLPVTGVPYGEEDYVPGPAAQVTLGPLGTVELFPLYTLNIYGPSNTGISGILSVVDALLLSFAPRTGITLASGDVVRIRESPAPYAGALVQASPGWAFCPVTIPCWIRTANAI